MGSHQWILVDDIGPVMWSGEQRTPCPPLLKVGPAREEPRVDTERTHDHGQGQGPTCSRSGHPTNNMVRRWLWPWPVNPVSQWPVPTGYKATIPSGHTLSFFIMSQAMPFGRPQSVHSKCPKHVTTISQTCNFTTNYIVLCAKQHGYFPNVPHNVPHISLACSWPSHLAYSLNVLSGWYIFWYFSLCTRIVHTK